MLSDDWKKDKKQEWSSSDFGDCAKIRYKVGHRSLEPHNEKVL